MPVLYAACKNSRTVAFEFSEALEAVLSGSKMVQGMELDTRAMIDPEPFQAGSEEPWVEPPQ